jgi:hypothetical protein
MAYRIRILSKSEARVPASRLRERICSGGIAAFIEVGEGDEETWDRIAVSHSDGDPIAIIEREPIPPAGYETSELAEYAEEVEGEQPESAARWLCDYFPLVRVIYVFQLLAGTHRDGGWAAVHEVQGEIWGAVGGIMQADGEGFTNEEGYHILWQFGEGVDGPWKMAVLGEGGSWTAFEMILSDRRHRDAFLAGRVPDGVKPLQISLS